MNSEGEKIVKFETYCPMCKHFQESEAEDTCHYCLQTPVNMYSHKPINFKEKER